ncbi:hypothetical protein F7734_54355 [Scytonema sp. UIC 10036]|nr:hypothetical protein [Scytonema sp. UIC 10036]MUH00784.1 hypothetical protein [Scytonema sp. UIC 10036]
MCRTEEYREAIGSYFTVSTTSTLVGNRNWVNGERKKPRIQTGEQATV